VNEIEGLEKVINQKIHRLIKPSVIRMIEHFLNSQYLDIRALCGDNYLELQLCVTYDLKRM
jgi:hypothetical protein